MVSTILTTAAAPGYYATGQAGAASTTPQRAINPSCFGTVTSARGNAEDTAARVRGLVDRICGGAPDIGTALDRKGPISDGLCDVATHDALRIAAALDAINEQMTRLELALP